MGDLAAAERVDALLEEGFHGSVDDFVDAIADEDLDVTSAEVAEVLRLQESAGGARKSPRDQWYRVGKLAEQAKPRRGVSGREIGSFARRLVYIPELVPNTFVLLTLREGTGAFRIRVYEPGATSPRMVWVHDANNDIVQLERLYGPFQHDIWWDDEYVKGVKAVDYWVDVIGKQNARLLGD